MDFGFETGGVVLTYLHACQLGQKCTFIYVQGTRSVILFNAGRKIKCDTNHVSFEFFEGTRFVANDNLAVKRIHHGGIPWKFQLVQVKSHHRRRMRLRCTCQWLTLCRIHGRIEPKLPLQTFPWLLQEEIYDRVVKHVATKSKEKHVLCDHEPGMSALA